MSLIDEAYELYIALGNRRRCLRSCPSAAFSRRRKRRVRRRRLTWCCSFSDRSRFAKASPSRHRPSQCGTLRSGKAVQNAVYDADGRVIAHVDSKNHGVGSPSGQAHPMPVPGDPGSGHTHNYTPIQPADVPPARPRMASTAAQCRTYSPNRYVRSMTL